ncbi:MAG: hypothetical protein Q7W13_03070 [Bacteroidia bacterium]|nr:hypothetical protein [Bacteroidia bacterium]
MTQLIINSIELKPPVTQETFFALFKDAKFVFDFQDKFSYSLKAATLTFLTKTYIVDLFFTFKNADLYWIEFWLPGVNENHDRQLVKNEYLKLKSDLLSIHNELVKNVRLHLDGSSIKRIHLIAVTKYD